MSKRGQATIFIIIGLVIAILIILIFFVRNAFFFGPVTAENLQKELSPIKQHIITCAEDVSPDFIEKIGLQGGYLVTPEDSYRAYESNQISYLCYDIPNSPLCYNRMLTLQNMQEQLAEHINFGLMQCLDIMSFKKYNYELILGERNTEVAIGKDIILVNVNYPITIKKGDVEVSLSDISVPLDYPLGRLYDVSQEIIDVETEFGEFDQLTYMLAKKGQIIIDKKRPYPDKLYILKTKDSPYIFQFFIQDEPS